MVKLTIIQKISIIEEISVKILYYIKEYMMKKREKNFSGIIFINYWEICTPEYISANLKLKMNDEIVSIEDKYSIIITSQLTKLLIFTTRYFPVI